MSKGMKVVLWICAIAVVVGLCYLIKANGDKAVTTTDITIVSNAIG